MTDADLTPTPTKKRIEQRRWTVLFPVVALIALAGAGLVLFALGTSSIGIEPLLVGAAAALIPVAFVVSAFLWIDRWEPEPAKMLLFAFVWGSCGATISSLAFNQTSRVLGDLLYNDGTTFTAVVGAPIVEEATSAALLHTEIMREHVLVSGDGERWALSGLFDFEPAMIGDPAYECASVGVFVTCGDATLLRRFTRAYGADPGPRVFLAYALLHKYSSLRWYLERVPPPPGTSSLDALAAAWWPS